MTPRYFRRPVSPTTRISAGYGDWSPYWTKHVDAQGLWVSGQVDGKGQHKGIDFATPVGTVIEAMAPGMIIAAGWENPDNQRQGFGLRVRQQVLMENGTYWTLVYGHLSILHCRAGDKLAPGDRIGLSGNTGKTSGPHLHIELVDAKMQYHEILFDRREEIPGQIQDPGV